MVISGLLSQEFKLKAIVENIPSVGVVWLREKLGAPVNWHSTDPSQFFKLKRAKKMIFTALTGMALLLSLSALGLTQVHAQASSVSLPLDSQWTKMNEPSAAEVPLKTPGAQALSLSDDNATARSARMAEATSSSDRLLVGVGDQIFITVFGQPDISAEVTVN